MWQEREARADRRAQAIMWMFAEINRDHKKKPESFTLEDFPIHQWSRVTPRDTKHTHPSSEQLSPAETQAWSEITMLRAMTATVYGKDAAELQTKKQRKKAKKHDKA